MKTLFYASLSFLVAVLAFGVFAVRPAAAAEESLLILTTSDTRAELAPCG